MRRGPTFHSIMKRREQLHALRPKHLHALQSLDDLALGRSAAKDEYDLLRRQQSQEPHERLRRGHVHARYVRHVEHEEPDRVPSPAGAFDEASDLFLDAGYGTEEQETCRDPSSNAIYEKKRFEF